MNIKHILPPYFLYIVEKNHILKSFFSKKEEAGSRETQPLQFIFIIIQSKFKKLKFTHKYVYKNNILETIS